MRTSFYNAEQAAAFLQYPNVQEFEHARREGNIPAPDMIFDRMPYWSIGLLEQNIEDHCEVAR